MATVPLPPYRDVDWDDRLEDTPLAASALTKGQLRVEWWLRNRAAATVLSLRIVEQMHRFIFEGIFPDFAGVLRGPAPQYVPCNVDFGNFRGEPYERVLGECSRLFENVERLIGQLDALRRVQERAQFREEALKVAAFTHCELIRIHPFRNGNGRVARVCINYFAARYGMHSVPFERPRDEYLDANRTWLRMRVIDHFVDVLRPFWQDNRSSESEG